jgi:hypothetical protein
MAAKDPERRDRISFRSLKGKRLIAELEIVKKDYHHNRLPKDAQYSRIARLVSVLPDEDWE